MTVSSRTKSLLVILSIICVRLCGDTDRPGPPGNSVSPENKCLPATKQIEPGVCPGVDNTLITILPAVIVSPSLRKRSGGFDSAQASASPIPTRFGIIAVTLERPWI